MLLKLSISNYAIIRDLVFEPVPGLNIITGETGAGKSIILDALDLVLGGRADIRTQSEWGVKSIVEGEFALDKDRYTDVFAELDIDFEDSTIIRREISPQGKSRTFVNDTPVSLQQLKILSDKLISVHSQHENSMLAEASFQFGLLDGAAQTFALLSEYREAFRSLRSMENKLEELRRQQDHMLKEKDYLSFLLNEFEQAGLKPNEEQELEAELNILSNAEQLTQLADWLESTLTASEQSVVDVLTQIKNKFKAIEQVHPRAAELSKRLQSAIVELKDMAAESSELRDLVQADDGRLEIINQRLMLIQNLKRKHGTAGYDELMTVHEHIADQLLAIGNVDLEIEKLKLSLDGQMKTALQLAARLHKARLQAAVKLKQNLESGLRNLEMPHARVEFDLTETNKLNEYGTTELHLKFTANLGMPPQLLGKVASGGELSRLALCIRSQEASQKHLNTLVFDEIDTGVSGKVADTIGKIFRDISASHQVIAITHLPQVAGYGDAHFMVCKREEGHTTVSYLKRLDKQERIEEIAKMLSGNESTEIAKKNALELIKH